VRSEAAERTAGQEPGRLEGNTPQSVYGWAQQNAIKAGQDAISGCGTGETWRQATQQLTVGRWLTAHGYETEGTAR
jgi:hypothetical protein